MHGISNSVVAAPARGRRKLLRAPGAGEVLILLGITLGGAISHLDAQSVKPLFASPAYSMFQDRVTQGTYTAEAKSSTELVSNYPVTQDGAATPRTWALQEDLSAFPVFHSPSVLGEAIYNLSLEELKRDTTSAGTFDAGAKWPGVWTRDASYSILLSLAAIDPEASKASLLKKVSRGRIIQDTGTGGSWPVSSDRICWALAAWEVYLVTGDRDWLAQSEHIVEQSLRDDEQVVIDPTTGLARGESSFLDWREQTYPRWMQPADIYSSKDLGTNAVFFRAYQILGLMNRELGQDDAEWETRAAHIQAAMRTHLQIEGSPLFGQYLYGRTFQSLSSRSDALGQALAVLFGVPPPAQQDEILRAQPLLPFGVPTVYPQTPGVVPYHNRSVWPFVQAFWNLASAKQSNESGLLYGVASLYRATALFLGNKENFVSDTGSPVGTAVNSDRQLWSVAGSLATVYRIFFGMEFTPTGLQLHPVIPQALQGTYQLTNFHYRGAVLSLTVRGFGHTVHRMTLDGAPTKGPIPASLQGTHAVLLELDNKASLPSKLNLVDDQTAPDTPVPSLQGQLTWQAIPGATSYDIYRDGSHITTTSATSVNVEDRGVYDEYQVAARDGAGVSSFLSVPVPTHAAPMVLPALAAAEGHPDFVVLEQTRATGLTISGTPPHAGRYSLTFRYANGSGPVNTNNKCAIRTLFVDDRQIGPIVLPQRGTDQWNDWGTSSLQIMQLSAEPHHFELRLLASDLNMDGSVNRAYIQSLTLTPLD